MSQLSRRTLITGIGVSIITAPAVVRYASLMPVRGIIMPIDPAFTFPNRPIFPNGPAAFGKYKLVGKTAVQVTDVLEWAKCLEASNRKVAHDVSGGAQVSTVFLGLDHNFMCEGPPVLFETMVFGGKNDGNMRRYTSYDDAERGHRETLAEVRRAQIEIVKSGDAQS